ncbi:beta-ketoacyl synthase domain-containing protein [Xylariaceae sp. FL1272]|nr:beta-ketoacyl synthase domain-containing protein [Xylariaceae sp. FL1272]
MGSSAVSQQPAKTVLLFGDQTDSWTADLDAIFRQAATTPWLQLYLDDFCDVVNDEIRKIILDRALRASLGTFSSLQELAERYRHEPDLLGMARALLLHAARSATLLQWVNREPQLLQPGAEVEWLGISGGLISLSAFAISNDFESLRTASLELSRVMTRLCKFTSLRSRAVEDEPGTWGWAVVGLTPDDLRKALDQFQQSMGVPLVKRAKLGVTGAGWSTVIGPPSVLERFMKQCPAVRNVAKNPLNINALQHTITLAPQDLDFIVGTDAEILKRPVSRDNLRVWGMDDPTADYHTWSELVRSVCSQVLSRPLDITEAIDKLKMHLDNPQSARVIQVGTTSHTPYLIKCLGGPSTTVSLDDGQSSAKPEIQDGKRSYAGRIAIIGMAGRGPGGDNVDELWDIIMSKQDRCTEVPKDRFDVDEFYCEEHGKGNKKCSMTTRYGCFMDNPGHFDNRFFHISPREAMLMDPCHRQFLTASYEALEMAGYSDGYTKATDPNRIATFYGQVTDDWHDHTHGKLGCDAYTLQGVQRAFGPGRLAWQFKWEGPTYSLDSACAATTSAIHLACMSLQTKDIDMAVVGASNILNYPHSFTSLSKAGVLSDTGNCKTYRDDADGYCRADFAGTVVLKRLEDAIADNDNVLAVVAGSGRNHSGNSTSITTSDAGAQERLFNKILLNSCVSPNDISYVEMHGTGTQVGDPAEMGAVANLFRHRRRGVGPVPVGSCKANFGHTEGAAGMVSLLKCIKMFQTDTIPPQAGMPHPLNPRFPPLSEINVEVPAEPKPFKKALGAADQPRRILLNNFDAAGGNACMLLEDYTPPNDDGVELPVDPRSSHVFTVTARTQPSHDANKLRLIQWLRENPEVRIQDLAYTTTARRMHHPFKFACTASSTDQLISKLEASTTTSSNPKPPASSHSSAPIVFVFTGQGSHYAGMGSVLYSSSPIFRESVDFSVKLCEEQGFPAFVHIITDPTIDITTSTTVQTQLAVLTLEIALASYWKSIGIQPSMVMGHSLGEYAALHVAGVLSLTDVLYLVGKRAELLLERCEEGAFAMLSLAMSASEASDFVKAHPQFSSCSVACMNSLSATVISGTTEEIEQLHAEVAGRSKMLKVPFGFHSFQTDSILPDYRALAEGVTFSAPRIPVASTLMGNIVENSDVFNARYLSQQTRQPVDFIAALKAVESKLASPIWLEIGPTRVCSSFIRSTLYSGSKTDRVLSTFERDTPDDAWNSISKCLELLYLQSVSIDWLAFHAPYTAGLKMLNLPAYAWDMKDYWHTYTEESPIDSSLAVSSSPVTKPIISTFAQHVVHESTTAGKIKVVVHASLADEGVTAVIEGHRMQKLPICPGSAFCEAAFAAAVYTLESIGRKGDAQVAKLAIREPVMSRPLTKNLVGHDGRLVTTATLNSASSSKIAISWQAIPASANTPMYELGSCTLEVCESVEAVQAKWDETSYFVQARMQEIIASAKAGHGHRFQPDIFYTLFASTVEYDSHYKDVKEAFVSADFTEAAAAIVLQPDPQGTKFTASPYWGEGIVHLAGFAVNANPQNRIERPDSCFINAGFGSFEQTVALEAGKMYHTYVRVVDKDEGNKQCEVFVFDSKSRMIARCSGLKFHSIRNVLLQHNLSGGKVVPATSTPVRKVVEEVQAPVKPMATSPPVEEIVEKGAVEPDSLDSGGVFEMILQTIIEETGIDASELTDSTYVADLGVDSIMSISIASKVSNATGLELESSFLIEYPSISDLRREFMTTPQSSSASDSGSVMSKSSDTSAEPDPESLAMAKEESNKKSPMLLDGVEPTASPKPEHPNAAETLPKAEAQVQTIDDSSPLPSARLTLLSGSGRGSKKGSAALTPPFYFIADGTGSIATYLHLPQFIKSKMPIYGIDSPYLNCPTRLTPEVGIPGSAKLIVEAILKKQPAGMPIRVGGFSGGAMLAYEVCRQLVAGGHVVEGLLLVDMCAPRVSQVANDDELGLAMFGAVSGQDSGAAWDASDKTQMHLRALFASVAAYNPAPLRPGESLAKRTALVWAEKGMIDRCVQSERFRAMLAERKMPTEAYPGFLEDPKLGAVAWSLPHKGKYLGPNGWDKFVGEELKCMSVPADHLEMPMPGFAHMFAECMDKAFEYFSQ